MSERSLPSVRNQQVVGSNPTGGSKKSTKFNKFFDHLGGRSGEPLAIARKLSEFVKWWAASERRSGSRDGSEVVVALGPRKQAGWRPFTVRRYRADRQKSRANHPDRGV